MAEKYYVYILKSQKDGKRYIGFTDDINKRFIQHQRGEVKSTKYRQPLKLIFLEKFDNKKDAHKRELFLRPAK